MIFYTYDYLLSKTHSVNIGHWLVIFTMLIILIVLAYFWIRKKLDYRFKEIGLLVLIILFLSVGVQLNSYNLTRSSDNQYSQLVGTIDEISKALKVDKEKVLVNRVDINSDPIVKIDDEFYTVHFSDDKANYLIEKIKLENQESIQVTDVEGGNQ